MAKAKRENQKDKATRVSLVSLGCPKNLVDSEVMLGLLHTEGYELTGDTETADIVIVNTCAFIEDAKQESIETIQAVADAGRSGQKLIVAGCLAQRYQDSLESELPQVNAYVGTGEFQHIATVCDRVQNQEPLFSLVNAPEFVYDHTIPRVLATARHYAYLKIAEGCDNTCSFCAIPAIRGKHRSRPIESILAEAEMLVRSGVHELVLISQDTTFYGVDLYGEKVLPQLLEQLGEIPDLDWVRILYAYPPLVDAPLLEAMAKTPNVCHYLDMPIQHIDDRMLKRMIRRTTGDNIRAKIQQIRASIPDITLRSTLIAGFPGETEEEFERLLDFASEARFDHLGVFAYSPEESTPAARMKEQIPDNIKQERVDRIVSQQQQIALSTREKLIGRRVSVLVDGWDGDQLYGRYEGQAPEIDDVIYLHGKPTQVGDFCKVEITDVNDYDLIGRIL